MGIGSDHCLYVYRIQAPRAGTKIGEKLIPCAYVVNRVESCVRRAGVQQRAQHPQNFLGSNTRPICGICGLPRAC
jgi:hypothetical protein